MPDVQEVFRMTTQKIRPEPGFVDRQYDHRRKQQRKRKIGAFAAAAVIGVAAVALIVNNLGGGESGTDIVDSPPQTAQEVATGFLDAYGAYDADRAIGYLANDADIKALMTEVGAQDVDGTVKEFRLLLSYLEAMGYTQILDPCEELGSSAAGTSLRCSFDFHALRSDEIELGPFGGSYFDLTVLDGRIVRASKFFATEGFSVEVWEPFAAFVSTAYPEDAAVMYVDDTYSEVRLTEASIRLWDEHTRGYVEEVQAGGA